jgi:1-acyl-sn-glycerol-3-phosphate acyltransferase
MTAFKLLKANQQVLLYPGGAREVNKRMGEEYRLFWRDSPDFVRLAARCNAIIVPFAAVGADDAYDGACARADMCVLPPGPAIRRAVGLA